MPKLALAFGAGDRLEYQVYRCAPFDGGHGVGHVGQHARLGRDVVSVDDVVQHPDELDDLRHVVGSRVDADDGVAVAVHQTIEHAGRDAGGVVGRVVRLQAGCQCASQPDRVTKPGHDAALARHQHQVLDAHDLRYASGHLRCDPWSGTCQQSFVGLFAQQPVAKVTDREVSDGDKCSGIVTVHDQPGDLVRLVRHDSFVQEASQRQLGQGHLGGDTLLGAAGSHASEIVARACRAGLGQQVAQIGKHVGTTANDVGDATHDCSIFMCKQQECIRKPAWPSAPLPSR